MAGGGGLRSPEHLVRGAPRAGWRRVLRGNAKWNQLAAALLRDRLKAGPEHISLGRGPRLRLLPARALVGPASRASCRDGRSQRKPTCSGPGWAQETGAWHPVRAYSTKMQIKWDSANRTIQVAASGRPMGKRAENQGLGKGREKSRKVQRTDISRLAEDVFYEQETRNETRKPLSSIFSDNFPHGHREIMALILL